MSNLTKLLDTLMEPWHEAYAAQNMAAAEIERQKARADAAEKEVERLRAELATVTKREADGVALFDDLLARERAEVAKLRERLEDYTDPLGRRIEGGKEA